MTIVLAVGACASWLALRQVAPSADFPAATSDGRRDPFPNRPAAHSAEEMIVRLDRLFALPPEQAGLFRTACDELAGQLSVKEADMFLRALDTMPQDPRREECRRALLGRLAQIKPLAALARAARLVDAGLRTDVLWMVARTDAPAACAWLLRPEHAALREELAPALITEWEEAHRWEAANLAAALPAGAAQHEFLGRLLAGWSLTDLPAALAWAQALDGGPAKELALQHLGWRWLDENPEEALAYAQSGEGGGGLLQSMVNHWAARDPNAATAWAARLPAGENRATLLSSLTASWAATSPLEAAHFAAELPGEVERHESVISAASGWGRQDPLAAIQWVTRFPAGPLRDESYGQVLFAWAQRDVVATVEWLTVMPEGVSHDHAFNAVSGAIVDQYPAVALDLAQKIGDRVLRRHRIENITRRWLEADPEAAAEELIKSEFVKELTAPSQSGG